MQFRPVVLFLTRGTIMSKRQLLAHRLTECQNEQVQLRHEISKCQHSFIVEEPRLGILLLPGDTPIGSTSDSKMWVNEQERTCEKCGLREKRLQTAPGKDWGVWVRQ